MKIGSLFSGIGGLDMGLERATGGHVVWFAENDAFCRQVLARHWPEVPCYHDVREIDEQTERPDIICGGFPCQDISTAGKGAGIGGKRSGLWVEFARVVRVLRPRFVFVENVAALTTRGLDRVLGDLAACGFDAEWDCIGACCVGAPHRRERLFILAADAERDILRNESGRKGGAQWSDETKSSDDGEKGDVAHSDRKRCARGRVTQSSGQQSSCRCVTDRCSHVGHEHATALRENWEAEPNVGRVADGVPSRVDRLRCLGNSVVPIQAVKAWEILSRRLMAREERL